MSGSQDDWKEKEAGYDGVIKVNAANVKFSQVTPFLDSFIKLKGKKETYDKSGPLAKLFRTKVSDDDLSNAKKQLVKLVGVEEAEMEIASKELELAQKKLGTFWGSLFKKNKDAVVKGQEVVNKAKTVLSEAKSLRAKSATKRQAVVRGAQTRKLVRIKTRAAGQGKTASGMSR